VIKGEGQWRRPANHIVTDAKSVACKKRFTKYEPLRAVFKPINMDNMYVKYGTVSAKFVSIPGVRDIFPSRYFYLCTHCYSQEKYWQGWKFKRSCYEDKNGAIRCPDCGHKVRLNPLLPNTKKFDTIAYLYGSTPKSKNTSKSLIK